MLDNARQCTTMHDNAQQYSTLHNKALQCWIMQVEIKWPIETLSDEHNWQTLQIVEAELKMTIRSHVAPNKASLVLTCGNHCSHSAKLVCHGGRLVNGFAKWAQTAWPICSESPRHPARLVEGCHPEPLGQAWIGLAQIAWDPRVLWKAYRLGRPPTHKWAPTECRENILALRGPTHHDERP